MSHTAKANVFDDSCFINVVSAATITLKINVCSVHLDGCHELLLHNNMS